MKQTGRKENRMIFSLVVGLTVVSLLCGTSWSGLQKNTMAWWGSIYPEFCFSEFSYDEENVEKNPSEQPPKISFWLAKAIERW